MQWILAIAPMVPTPSALTTDDWIKECHLGIKNCHAGQQSQLAESFRHERVLSKPEQGSAYLSADKQAEKA